MFRDNCTVTILFIIISGNLGYSTLNKDLQFEILPRAIKRWNNWNTWIEERVFRDVFDYWKVKMTRNLISSLLT